MEEIDNVPDYLVESFEFRTKSMESGEVPYFRGQKNNWSITPSLFRSDNLIRNEAKLIHLAHMRNPVEFANCNLPFEKLTKLQHYGLCTRLLDVTLNPLVALYFACQKNEMYTASIIKEEVDETIYEDEENKNNKIIYYEKKATDGVVYFGSNYATDFSSADVSLISMLAEIDDKELKIESVVSIYETILNKHNIPNPSFSSQQIEIKCKNVLDLLSQNRFVVSSFSNDRLIQQSGAFLLPGFEVIPDDDIIYSKILRSKQDFKNDFSKPFIIPADKKELILDELDFYNINESTLFPELEHQMKYVMYRHQEQAIPNSYTPPQYPLLDILGGATFPFKSRNHYTENVSDDVDSHTGMVDIPEAVEIILNSTDPNLIESVNSVFNSYISELDWYKKDSVKAQLRKDISNILREYKFEEGTVKNKATELLEHVIKHSLNPNNP
jgi:FRG domain.